MISRPKLLPLLSCFFLCLMACSGSENNEPTIPEPDGPTIIEGVHAIVPPTGQFAKDNGAIPLHGSASEKVATLLTKAGLGITESLGNNLTISIEQYKEIKVFTDKLTENVQTPKDIYQTIFEWITTNIQYASGYVDNDPYPVFQTKQAICQGYANLLKVMLHSKGIPVINANGMLNPIGGHAWNYVYVNDWYVSDPTNNSDYLMNDFKSYTHLIPMSLDVNLFEDEEFVFNYSEERLNLLKVKKSERQLTVPFSTNGFQVSAFNPDTVLPTNVEEIYIGKNIESLGENILGLGFHAPSVKYVYVDPDNQKMESYGQVVYRNLQPYYIPAAATIIQFKNVATIGKNFLKDHDKVEAIVIQPGTQSLEPYAFENCPKLQKAYIPEETDIANNAFYGVHPDFSVIRGIIKN